MAAALGSALIGDLAAALGNALLGGEPLAAQPGGALFDGLTAVLTTEAVGTYLSVLLVVATADEGKATAAQAVGLGYAALTFFGAEVSDAYLACTSSTISADESA